MIAGNTAADRVKIMAALSKADIKVSELQSDAADVIPFPLSRRSAKARLEDLMSMCVGYISLAGFVSGMALFFIR